MSKTPSNDVLLEKIDNLTIKIDEGFKGVHERQDYTNGKVTTNTEWRIQQQAIERERDKNWANARWIIGLIGLGTLANIIKNFTNLL